MDDIASMHGAHAFKHFFPVEAGERDVESSVVSIEAESEDAVEI